MRAAVIPIKLLTDAKTRLSASYSLYQRQALCLTMLRRLLTTLTESNALNEIFVITPDWRVRRFVRRHFPNVQVLLDVHHLSLNDSAIFAGQLLRQRGFDAMLFLLGDLPMLTPNEVREALALSENEPVVLIPDRRREGTNGLLLSPPDALQPLFGAQSFERHLRYLNQLGKPFAIFESSGFGWDVDTPADLHALCGNWMDVQRCIVR